MIHSIEPATKHACTPTSRITGHGSAVIVTDPEQHVIPAAWRAWWPGDRPDGSSTVLAFSLYRGRYAQSFTHVLRLAAPRVARGWLEIAVDLRRATEADYA
jgi:hypothetical protein